MVAKVRDTKKDANSDVFLKTVVLKPPSCTPFSEDEVPLRLSIAPSKCFIVAGQNCYKPDSYYFGSARA